MPARRFPRRSWFPLTILAIGTISTALVSRQLQRSAVAGDRERFEVAVDRLQDSIQDRVDMYVAMLRAGAAMLTATDLHTPAQFHVFAEHLRLQRRYPGVQGIGYSERFAAADLPRVLAERRQLGDPGFHVWPAGERTEYHSILYLEPLDRRNQAAIGYDMSTDATRRAAMERARDTGEPAASGRVTLVQEIDENKQPGFLIYMPVYSGGSVPSTVEERRARLRGFVYSPFRADDLFAGILGRNPHPRAGFALFDGRPAAGSLLHRTDVPGQTSRLTTTRDVDVAGMTWTAEFFSTAALDAGSTHVFVPLTLSAGGILTGILTVLALLQVRARERAEQSEAAVEDAAKRSHDQAQTLAIINRTGAHIAGELDLDRLVQHITDAGTALTRAQFGAFFYNRVHDNGESYTLYALSGASREAFDGFPMPRNTELFRPTFRGEGIVRSGDITADPRYGQHAPYHGMPPGHLPVRSYLAVPVKSRSGEVLGGLFFGHSDRDVFTDQAEHILCGMAAQAAIAIDNARLYGRVQELLSSERAARSEAERVSGMKDEFLATLSHELRTPLNAVMGWAHMLNSGSLTNDHRSVAVETILRNARIQSKLIDDLLDMSRIISGRLRVDMTLVNLDDVIEAAVNVVKPTADAKRVQLSVEAEPGLHSLRADGARLQQVLWNLLANAIKFTPAGGRVVISTRRSGEDIELSVTDTGIGISPDFLPHVFERFRQGDGSFTRGHGGLGLGLSIARNLVEMHGGTIEAASAGANRGSTFTLRFPAVVGV
ncbi:MAG TPA: CHASE domain-containing protein [Vicinamibacterales bacterium]|nr:CHASE domain-containing protein [Vicinamibacterales bacterium]